MARADQGWREHVLNNILPTMLTEPATGFTPAPLATVVAPTPLAGDYFHVQPAFDVIELLPERAQDRLRNLRDRAADAHAICVPFADIQEASTARIAAENRLRQLQDHPQNSGHNLPPDDSRVVTQQRLVNKLTDDFRRLQERSETKTTAWQAASQALANVESWLRHGKPGGCTLQGHEAEMPELKKGEKGLIDAIEGRRRRVRELRADAHRARSAPYPSSYAKQRLRQMVEQFAARAVPDVSGLIEHDQDIQWGTQQVRSAVYNAGPGATAFHDEVDVVGLFANLLKPAMISFLDTLVDAEQDDAAALTHEQRQQAEAEVMDDLLAVEREESVLVWQAQSENLPVEHRSDCSPIALLGLRLVTAPRADALPGSSPQHAAHNLLGGGR